MQYTHFVLNSNPWFSAVSDFSLQLSLILKEDGHGVLYCAEKKSTAMEELCARHDLPFYNLPVHNQNPLRFIKNLVFLCRVLKRNKANCIFFWTFEGREHTVAGLCKLLFPRLWKNALLIRVRGQQHTVKNRFFSRLLYNRLTDFTVCAAWCVRRRIQFSLPPSKVFITYYGKNLNPEPKDPEKALSFLQESGKFDFNSLTFLLVGRFDPVKGHGQLIDAFLQTSFADRQGNPLPAQLLLIGENAQIKASDLYGRYSLACDESWFRENIYFFHKSKEKKSILILNKKCGDIYNFMRLAHFGVIPSLDSEVICRVGVEFLQCGTPVLCSDAGALSEVFSAFPENIFPAGDEKKITEKLLYAKDIFLKPNEYSALKEKCVTVGQNNFSSKNYIEILTKIKEKNEKPA